MQHRPLLDLRTAAGLTQVQLAERMHMSRTAYLRLEAGHTVLKLPQLYQLATALGLSMSQILNLPDGEAASAELNFMRHSIESQVISRLAQAELGYQEAIPFAELGEREWEWLHLCGIETRQQYEAAPTLVTRTNPDASTTIFANLVQDMDIYAWFTHGIIQDEYLLQRWHAHQASHAPYFTFEPGPFGRVLARTANSSTPEDLPPYDLDPYQGESEEFWQIMQQNSDAQHVADCLHEAVHDPEWYAGLSATLRHDPAAYNRTLTRLIGLVWAIPGIGADNVVGMEERRLQGGNEGADVEAYYTQISHRWAPH